ncbi:hypothetical protein Tco_0032733 [Tanacetum coccineum]
MPCSCDRRGMWDRRVVHQSAHGMISLFPVCAFPWSERLGYSDLSQDEKDRVQVDWLWGSKSRVGMLIQVVDSDNAIDEECVDEAPTVKLCSWKSIIRNYPVCDEAGHHEETRDAGSTNQSYVVGSHADYTSDSNMTPYDQNHTNWDTEGERGFEQQEMLPHGGHSIFQNSTRHFEGNSKSSNKEVKEMSDAFDKLEAELDQSIVDRKHDEIEQKNLLIEHDNIIADGLSKEVFYVASNSELNVSRFTEMQKAHNVVKARCLELEAELSSM